MVKFVCNNHNSIKYGIKFNIVNIKSIFRRSQANNLTIKRKQKTMIHATRVAFTSLILTLGVAVNTAIAFPTNQSFTIKNNSNPDLVIDGRGAGITLSSTGAQLYSKSASDYELATSNFVAVYDAKLGTFELQLKQKNSKGQTVCLGTDKGLNWNSMGDGTSLVFTTDCTNVNNWTYDGTNIHVSRRQELCIDVAWGKVVKNQGLQLVSCKKEHVAQSFGLVGPGGSSNSNLTPPQPAAIPQPKPQPQKPTQPQTPAISSPIATPKPIAFKTAGVGWNAPINYDLNILSPDFGYLKLGDGKKVKVNIGNFGHTFTYFNVEEGQYLVSNLKTVRGDTAFLLGTGLTSFMTKIPSYFSKIASGFGGYYTFTSDQVINNSEWCITKNKGFWIDAQQGVLFLEPKVTCDR
jgi:hypothetical protein